MSVNFRMSYNEGFDYVDLFPCTKIENIDSTDNSLKYSSIIIEVPPTNKNEQTIKLYPNIAPLVDLNFFTVLLDTTPTAQLDYNTISTIQLARYKVGEGAPYLVECHIRRDGVKPKGKIRIKLFFEKRKNNNEK